MRDTVEQLQTLAQDCATTPVWSLNDDDLLAWLDAIHTTEQTLAAVKLHLIHQADTRDLPTTQHAPTCAMWLRHRLRISIHTAKRLVDLAQHLDRRPHLDTALTTGTLNTEQAHTIATTINDLPTQIGTEAITTAEGMLIDYASEFDPLALRKLGTRILTHVAPEVAEKAEAAALARQEAKAHTNRGLTLTPHRNGRVRITGWLDHETAAIINAALDPLCTPTQPHTPTPPHPPTTQPTTKQPPIPDRDKPPADNGHTRDWNESVTDDGHSPNWDQPLSHGPSWNGNEPASNRPGPHGDDSPLNQIPQGWDEPPITNPRNPDRSEPLAGANRADMQADLLDHADLTGLEHRQDGDEQRVTRDERTPAQRRADALAEICRLVLAGAQLPDNGGDRPQVVVTVPFDLLRQQLGTATLDTGERLSATQARRLACDASIIPAVLGGDGQVLDLGTSRRLFTGALRRALVLRDRGCAFPQCDRHPRWTEGHHVQHWSQGGQTTLDNGVLLCSAHHRVVHQGDWTIRLGSDRLPEFVPPAYLDPERRPRRNIYHHKPQLVRR